MSFGVSLSGAFLAGLLSFASPCLLPLLPAYLGFLGGSEALGVERDGKMPAAEKSVLGLALAFVLGFSTIFVLLGATASRVGQLLLQYASTMTLIAGVLLILFGLHFLGAFRVPFLYRQLRFEVAKRPTGPVSAFVVGLAFGFGWTPCVGPVLAGILMVAGTQASVGRGTLMLVSYAAGIGIPFLLAAIFTRPVLRWVAAAKKRIWLVEKISGVLLIFTGIIFLGGFMPRLSELLLDYFPVLGQIG